jgi:cytochrome c peroxidase
MPAPFVQATRRSLVCTHTEIAGAEFCATFWRDDIMNTRSKAFTTSHIINASKHFALGVAFACTVVGVPQTAMAQKVPDATSARDFAAPMIEHMQKMRRYRDPDHDAQPTPRIIDRFRVDLDPKGAIASFQPNGATITSNNAFFKSMGTNDRTCFSCHQPQSAWTVVPRDIAERFERSRGTDPIFRLVDGATCPSDDVSSLRAKRSAYRLLLDKGLIRIGLAIPATAEFVLTSVNDPYKCSNNPAIGTSGILSMYRRPLPSTNVSYLSTVMWDGRESTSTGTLDSDLRNQAVDATLGHAQASQPPTPEQIDEIVAFQKGIFTAQIFDKKAKFLTDDNAKGGPGALSQQEFFIGINDPLGLNPKGNQFTSQIFDLYRPWLNAGERHEHGEHGTPMASEELLKNINITDDWRRNDHERGMVSEHRRSIARGEKVFNDTKINITGVAGLNDDLNTPSIPGFCGTCHDSPNIGHHSVRAPLDIGVPDAGAKKPPVLDIAGLPVFTLTCTQGALAGKVYTVTDPGRAMITGKCKDIGRFKGPILRGLAARAPYFHNGSAETLDKVVDFYDQRFSIGLTHQQKTDLVNFLNTL